MNVISQDSASILSRIFETIGKPARLQILLAIGDGETCVCHLENLLNLRQAYISQHLMALRSAGILETRREGRFIYYRLKDARLLKIIEETTLIDGFTGGDSIHLSGTEPILGCPCPKCNP